MNREPLLAGASGVAAGNPDVACFWTVALRDGAPGTAATRRACVTLQWMVLREGPERDGIVKAATDAANTNDLLARMIAASPTRPVPRLGRY